MNAGLEISCVLSPRPGGIATYAIQLARQLAEKKEIRLSLLYKLSRLKKRKYCPDIPGTNNRWHALGAWPRGFDLVHCTDSVYFQPGRSVSVITIHDLAIFHDELNRIPGYTSEKFREKMWRNLSRAITNCQGIVCVSESTRKDLDHFFPGHGKKVCVTHLGVKEVSSGDGSGRIRSNFGLEKPYLLFAGAISIRKNLINLIAAYDESGLKENYDLVLAGEDSMGADRIRDEVRKRKLDSYVRFTGYMRDPDLYALYRNSAAFLMPTYYEGFGLPAMEAMSLGIPVLAGNRGSLPEITNGHAVTCDPFDSSSVSKGIVECLQMSPQARLQAEEYARSFTWARCADKTLEFYRSFF